MMLRSRANELPEIIVRLGSRSPARVDAARARLSIIGARAVEALIEALEGDNNRIRDRVMPLLALIQDPRGREPLIAMLLDRSAKLRETAARCLARFPSPDAVVALNRVLQRDVSSDVRIAAAQSLVEHYAAGQEQAICRLLDLLMHADQEVCVRVAALPLIPVLHESQRRSVLARLEEDADRKFRRKAASFLMQLQSGESSRSPDLEQLLKSLASESYAEWNSAVLQLGACGVRMVKPLIAEMRSRSHDPEYCTRAGMALKALGPRRGGDVAEALQLVQEPLPLQILVEVIGAIGEKSMIYRLKDLIERIAAGGAAADKAQGFDPMQRVRAKAHLELARIGSRVAINDLRDWLADDEKRVELETLGALELIGNRGEIGLLLRVHSREDDFMKARIGDVIRAIMKRERLRRNDRVLNTLTRGQRQALLAILPPVRPRSSRQAGRPTVEAH